jgi:hypothetical protein
MKMMRTMKTTIRSTLGKEVGVCRESFTFISESKLPPDIVQLRNKDYISELENGVVNFYAHYVLADIDPDTGVETDFFGLPLMLCAGAAVLGCKNRKKEEDE